MPARLRVGAVLFLRQGFRLWNVCTWGLCVGSFAWRGALTWWELIHFIFLKEYHHPRSVQLRSVLASPIPTLLTRTFPVIFQVSICWPEDLCHDLTRTSWCRSHVGKCTLYISLHPSNDAWLDQPKAWLEKLKHCLMPSGLSTSDETDASSDRAGESAATEDLNGEASVPGVLHRHLNAQLNTHAHTHTEETNL